jgi:TRAP-type C4-dicarboxylate transport system substrate-binding protein
LSSNTLQFFRKKVNSYKFKRQLEEQTAGKIRAGICPGNQLGDQRDVAEDIQLASVQMSGISAIMAGSYLN